MGSMFRKLKKVIFVILLIFCVYYIFYPIFSFGMFVWESKDIVYMYYRGDIYTHNPNEHLIWEEPNVAKHIDNVVQVGWTNRWLIFTSKFYSDRKNNPDFIYQPYGDMLFFKEDMDMFAEPVFFYDNHNRERIGSSIVLRDLIKPESIEFDSYYEFDEFSKTHQIFNVFVFMEKYPYITNVMEIFSDEEQWYIILDPLDGAYSYKAYPLSDELAREICEFYGIAYE